MILSDQSVDLNCLLGFGLFDIKEVEVGREMNGHVESIGWFVAGKTLWRV